VVFVVVAFVALKFAWDARLDQIRSESEQRSSELERLRKDARDAMRRDEDRTRAEAKAAAFYELIRQGRRNEVVDGYDAVKSEPLTRTEASIFADAVERFRNDLAALAYQSGRDRAQQQRWQDAAVAFEESLKLKDDSAVAAQVRLGLGEAYRHLGRQRDAIPILSALAEGAPDRDLQDDALYFLAQCQTEIQAWNDAKSTWRTLLRRFPESHFAAEARMLLAQLSQSH
jgi:TolA-binding protein